MTNAPLDKSGAELSSRPRPEEMDNTLLAQAYEECFSDPEWRKEAAELDAAIRLHLDL